MEMWPFVRMTAAIEIIMIKKVICPTDFSDVAQNAMSYAAKLCQVTGASLQLVHVEPVLVAEQLFAPRRITRDVQEVSQELNNVCNEINRMFGISCDADVDTSGIGVGEAIGRRGDNEHLIVIGTNGADTFYQKIFGSNAWQTVVQTYPNVLVIPDKVEYATITTLVCAWEYDMTKHEVFGVKNLAAQLKCNIHFLHISRQDTQISQDIYKGFADRIREDFQLQDEIECRRMINEDAVKGLTDFMKDNPSAILALSLKNGKLIRKLLQGGQAGVDLPRFPLLITHND